MNIYHYKYISIILVLTMIMMVAIVLNIAMTSPLALANPRTAPSKPSSEIAIPQSKPLGLMTAHVGDMTQHTTLYEDTLLKIARANNLGFVEIRAANPGIDPWLPGAGKKITLPTQFLLPKAPRQGIVINLSEMRLYLFAEAGKPPITYPIGIGRDGLDTPLGSTRIIKKKAGPTWFPTQRMREEDPTLPRFMGPGPENPLGTHALYLGWPTFLIHGTHEPWGIGRRVSSGCIRLYPEHIKILYDQAAKGTRVTIVDQSIKVGWIGRKLYLEADISQTYANAMEENGAPPPLDLSKDDMKLILDEAGEHANLINWTTVREILLNRHGYPIPITPEIQDSRHASLR